MHCLLLFTFYLSLYGAAVAAPLKKKKKTTKGVSRNNAIALMVGVDTPFGQGLSYHRHFGHRVHGLIGGGYSVTGAKGGLGLEWLPAMMPTLGVGMGVIAAYGTGSRGNVSLDAKFQDEGSLETKAIVVSKEYQLSGALIVTPTIGLWWLPTPVFLVGIQGHYNAIVSGNQVTLGDRLTVDPLVEIVNQDSFNKDFDQRAKEKAALAALGASLSVRYLF